MPNSFRRVDFIPLSKYNIHSREHDNRRERIAVFAFCKKARRHLKKVGLKTWLTWPRIIIRLNLTEKNFCAFAFFDACLRIWKIIFFVKTSFRRSTSPRFGRMKNRAGKAAVRRSLTFFRAKCSDIFRRLPKKSLLKISAEEMSTPSAAERSIFCRSV